MGYLPPEDERNSSAAYGSGFAVWDMFPEATIRVNPDALLPARIAGVYGSDLWYNLRATLPVQGSQSILS